MKKYLLGALAALWLTTTAHAGLHALQSRPGGMVYDPDQDITWLQDWNQAAGSPYDSPANTTDGGLSGGDAYDWTNDLVYGGFDDWRLPLASGASALRSCPGAATSCGEMAYLFYNYLGGHPTESVLNQTGDTALEKANLAKFTNLRDGAYWLGPVVFINPSDPITGHVFGTAPFFIMGGDDANSGGTFNADILNRFSVVAVRSGDVAAVPEPETYALMLAGLAVVGAAAKRRKPA